MNFLIIRDLLNGVLPGKVYHYEALEGEKTPYIVWAEDIEGDTLYTDDRRSEVVQQGTIDLYTKKEYDPIKGQIETALDEAGICFWYNGAYFDNDTKIIHHEWIWEVA